MWLSGWNKRKPATIDGSTISQTNYQIGQGEIISVSLTSVAQAGMGGAGILAVAGLAIGAIYMASQRPKAY